MFWRRGIEGDYSKALPSSLATLCRNVSQETIQNRIERVKPSEKFARAEILVMFVLHGASHFLFKTFSWDRAGIWQSSRKILKNTSADVIAVETIIWFQFLMGRLWQNEKDREAKKRVGLGTLKQTFELCLSIIESECKYDFREQAVERRRLYMEAMKTERGLIESFSSVLLASLARRHVSDPLSKLSGMPSPELAPINMKVSVFFTTMPSGIYESYNLALKYFDSSFPHDEEFD